MNELPDTMTAVLLTGHGGFEMLSLRDDVPVPRPAAGEVLIEVGAAGVNNTDINTRIGWYSKTITTGSVSADPVGEDDTGGWEGVPLTFPRVQGADACGRIIAVGTGVDPDRIGERVIVRTMQAPFNDGVSFATATLGSEMDGSFAQYLAVRSSEAFAVRSGWTDVELASIPCAYSTAENMLHRSSVTSADRVLVTGASGGVGSAVVQLAKRRGAHVTAQVGSDKAAAVLAIGADAVVHRDDDLVATMGPDSVDVVVDLVAGPRWGQLLDVLARGGRFVTSGAIGGPIVELDVRTLYLKDLTVLGATYQPRSVFEELVGIIERNEIRPLVHATYPLEAIVEAQRDFLAKGFVGKLVLVPPSR